MGEPEDEGRHREEKAREKRGERGGSRNPGRLLSLSREFFYRKVDPIGGSGKGKSMEHPEAWGFIKALLDFLLSESKMKDYAKKVSSKHRKKRASGRAFGGGIKFGGGV